MHSRKWDRTEHLVPISLLTILFFVAAYFYYGYTNAHTIKVQWINYSLTGALAFLLYMGVCQYNTTQAYAQQVDNRIYILKTLQKKGNQLATPLNALPTAGLLYSAEINTDTSYFSNKDLKKALGLKFNIYKK